MCPVFWYDPCLSAESWRKRIRKLSDFTVTDPEVNRYRFCSYIPEAGESGCTRCLESCPSGALPNSSPAVSGQRHRFWEGALQFDNGKCLDYRLQMGELYPDWSCGRCLSFCGGEGATRSFAAENGRGFRFP